MLKLALAASTGAAIGCLLLLSVIMWPAAWWEPGTVRIAVAVGVVIATFMALCRRQDDRHREVMRAIRHGNVADDVEAYLRSQDG